MTGPARAQTGQDGVVLRDLTFDQLAAITITSVSKSEEKYFASAAAVQVVTGDAIRRSGATTIPDVLRTVPGVEVAMINSRSYAVTIRGFNGTTANKLLTLVDGRSLYSLRFASTIWDIRDVPLEDVEQIEVIAGPGGTTWGANAVNGVINIVTKHARDTQGQRLSVSAGNFETASVYARQGLKTGANSWLRLYVRGFQRDDSEPVNFADNNDAWGLVRSGFRFDHDTDAAQTMATGDYFYSNADQLLGGAPGVARSKGGHLLVRHRRALATGRQLTLQTYLDSVRRDSGGNQSEADTLDAEVLHELPIGENQQLSWGANVRRSRLKDTVTTPGTVADFRPLVRHFNQGGLFLQDVIHPGTVPVTLTVGAKAEYNDFTRWEYLPSLRAAWTPTEFVTSWVSAARAVRIPSRFEHDQSLTISPPGFTLRTLPSPDLQAENLWAYELGGRWRTGATISVAASVFWHDYRRLVTNEDTLTITPPGLINRLANFGTGRGYGAELAVVWQPQDWWRLQLGWSHLDLATTVSSASTDTALAGVGNFSPKNQFSLGSSWNLGRAWEVDVRWRHVGELPSPSRVIPAYTELDLRINRQLDHGWEVSLVGQNLLNRNHPEFRFFTVRAEVARSVYLRLDWRH
jgi:iron complex outermembrane receptor protein